MARPLSSQKSPRSDIFFRDEHQESVAPLRVLRVAKASINCVLLNKQLSFYRADALRKLRKGEKKMGKLQRQRLLSYYSLALVAFGIQQPAMAAKDLKEVKNAVQVQSTAQTQSDVQTQTQKESQSEFLVHSTTATATTTPTPTPTATATPTPTAAESKAATETQPQTEKSKEAQKRPVEDLKHYDKSGLQQWYRYFVDVESLKVRAKPEPKAEVLGKLMRNDRVQIVDLLDATTNFVEVKVTRGELMSLNEGNQLFVPFEYLSSSDSQNTITTKYFVIQNIATEVTRVYEKCNDSPKCKHKLIFETDMVVGRRKNGFVDRDEWFTNVGVTKIRHWVKWHQDSQGHYPAWYAKDYPPVPPPGADFFDWFDSSVMPEGKGSMRGAFGWFAAILGPSPKEQWIHGTAGWGSDGAKFIDITRDFFLSSVSDVRSSGCTRIENAAVAFLRHILAAGTPIIRVYAKEAVEDPFLFRYEKQKIKGIFRYILTKSNTIDDAGAGTIERSAVLARKVPKDYWLEEGTYYYDRYPTVHTYSWSPGGIGSGTGALGNVYNVDEKWLKGHFLIDTGRFVNYDHPWEIPKAGMSLVVVPDYTKAPSTVKPQMPFDSKN